MNKATVEFVARINGMGEADSLGEYVKIVVIEDNDAAVHHFQMNVLQAELLGRDLLMAVRNRP